MLNSTYIQNLNNLLVKQTRKEIIELLKSLKTGDKIEITHKIDNSGSGLKKTVATVTMSDEEVGVSYTEQGYVKKKTTVYISVRKGGGAIYDYDDKYGIQWQPTMLTPIKEVSAIKKIGN